MLRGSTAALGTAIKDSDVYDGMCHDVWHAD